MSLDLSRKYPKLNFVVQDRPAVIEQAKGILSRTHGIDVDAAFELMRLYARRHGHRISDVARAVVTDPAEHPELTTRT